jgi:acetyl esterase
MKKPLRPELSTWLTGYNELIAELERDGFVDTPETARMGLARLTSKLVSDSPTLANVCDVNADGPGGVIPLRIYLSEADVARPVLVYLHGGGHMAGSIEVYDPICRKLALATGRIVVSVDYRLAPEHPYPAGLEDAEATLRQVFGLLETQGIDCQCRLALGGDSGGGAMAATLSHQLQIDPEINIEHQLLIYPSLDYTLQHPSIEDNGRGYLLHSDKIEWFFDHYLQGGEDRKSVSPLHMDFTSELPETLLVTAGYDPLRDEGLAYRERLAQTDVAHHHLHFADQIHAFLNMEEITAAACREFYRSAGEFLGTDLSINNSQ